MSVVRTTIYLAGPAAEALERVRTEYRKRYGIATTVSSVVARLLLGEPIDEVVDRPYRTEIARIAAEKDKLHDALRRAKATGRGGDLHRIHREVADLFPGLKRISNTLSHAKRRNEPYSPDLTEATRLEENLNELMGACADAIVPRRRR